MENLSHKNIIFHIHQRAKSNIFIYATLIAKK